MEFNKHTCSTLEPSPIENQHAAEQDWTEINKSGEQSKIESLAKRKVNQYNSIEQQTETKITRTRNTNPRKSKGSSETHVLFQTGNCFGTARAAHACRANEAIPALAISTRAPTMCVTWTPVRPQPFHNLEGKAKSWLALCVACSECCRPPEPRCTCGDGRARHLLAAGGGRSLGNCSAANASDESGGGRFLYVSAFALFHNIS